MMIGAWMAAMHDRRRLAERPLLLELGVDVRRQ